MDDGGRWILFLAFLMLGFLFCATETALLSMNEGKIKDLMENDKKHRRVEEVLFNQPIKKKIIWMNLTYLICACGSVYNGMLLVNTGLDRGFGRFFEPGSFWDFWGAGIGFGLLSFLLAAFVTLTLSNMLPRRIFSIKPEKVILNLFPVTRMLSYLFRPLVFLVVHSANGLAALFGFHSKPYDDSVTEEEIRNLVDEGEEMGVIEQEEREMINNIFDFDDRTAYDLMTHRTDVVAVDFNSKISDVVYFAINEGFSRIPVYEDDIDNIKGVIYVKDLLCLVGCNSSQDFKISDFIREIIYIPEAKKCIDLFKTFKLKKIHMAVVVDDYGGTAGIITMEDLLESIVGNIQDEYDDEQEEVIKLSDTAYLLDGAVELEDINKLFRTHFGCDDEESSTIGGLITETLGRIPDDNESPSIELEGVRFTAIVIEDRRIVKVKAELLPPGEEESDNCK